MFDFFSKICDCFIFFSSVLKPLVEKVKEFRKNYYIKKIMGLKNKTTIVTFSIFEEKKINNTLHELITFDTLNILKEIMNIGTKTGVCIEVPPCNQVHLVKVNGVADEINIGGPLTNKYVHNYLSKFNKFVFYKKCVDEVKLDHVIENDCIRETDDNDGRYFTIGEKKYYIDNETDYLLLIRFRQLNGKKIIKTVHLMFNFHHNAIVNIFKIYSDFTKVLYQVIKKHKHNYFIVIPINKNTGIFEIDKIEDRTSDFFVNTSDEI